jgi:hypothetical protein
MDDCAFGAMMSLASQPKFRKLRFQMIADTFEFVSAVKIARRYVLIAGSSSTIRQMRTVVEHWSQWPSMMSTIP